MANIWDFVTITSIENPEDKTLLHRFYNELMVPSFPDEGELDALEVWEDMLARDRRKRQHFSYVSIKMAFDKNDKERKHILGGVVYEYYRRCNCYLLTYLVIQPEVRSKGLGVFICMEAWKDWNEQSKAFGYPDGCDVIFVEANDPKALPEDAPDGMDAADRLRAFQQMGVRALQGFQYTQPALDETKDNGKTLLLGVIITPKTAYDDNGKPYVPAYLLRDFLYDYWSDCEVPDFVSDPDFQEMMRFLSDKERIPIVDFDIPRRKKTKVIAAAAGSGPKPSIPLLKTSYGTPMHVIVIGAGLAGLTAAQALRLKGYKVTVLEARHRIGGRLYTGRSWDTRVDLGASWVHGTEGNPLYDFIKAALPEMKFFAMDDTVLLRDANGVVLPEEMVATMYGKFQQLLELASKKEGLLPNASLQEVLQDVYASHPELQAQTPQEKVAMNYFLSNMESFNATPLKELSALHHRAGDEFAGGDHIPLGGFHNVALHLSRHLDVVQGAEVTKIEIDTRVPFPSIATEGSSPSTSDSNKQLSASPVNGRANRPALSRSNVNGEAGATNGNGASVKGSLEDARMDGACRVHTKDGKVYRAHAVICTIPIGVLQQKTLVFEPPLPRGKRAAICRLGSGTLNKVLLRFDKVFWEDSDYLGFNHDLDKQEAGADLTTLHATRANSWFVNYHRVTQQPILVALVSAELAQRFATLNDKEIVAYLMRVLGQMYGTACPAQPVDAVITRWDQDLFARGSYSFMKKGAGPKDLQTLAEPCHQALFWAGEWTHPTRFSFADGAYASGLREADRIHQLFTAPPPPVTPNVPSVRAAGAAGRSRPQRSRL